jgi:hypothetical protein
VPLICETILITADEEGTPHIAPLGLIADAERWIIAPFRPSKTLDNLYARPFFIANLTDDARFFAGCLTGRRAWPLALTRPAYPPRLVGALSHWELEVEETREEPVRPQFVCRVQGQRFHAPFAGHSRAFAAVVEAAVLVSRLHLLSLKEIESEFSRLRVIVFKTAGPREAEAFGWLETWVANQGRTS